MTFGDFLAVDNLVRRHHAASAHLSRMPGDQRLVNHTAWALTALNVIGWILIPVTAAVAGGLRFRNLGRDQCSGVASLRSGADSTAIDWWQVLSCRAPTDAGPFQLLIRGVDEAHRDCRQPVSWSAGNPNLACTGDLVELAEVIVAALREAGCPAGQTISAVGGSLATLARQAGPESTAATLGRRVWQGVAPGAPVAPGDPGFRRPSCCGLMPMAQTDAVCCPDCPQR
ncbi:hypothetical protein [Acidipropionibacterium jensenii]|uniref:hypothetical protein n=1 Tax=Acidipropionibacterium jensenii TaxID=1749 RepID=UPI00214C064B|nr:hypothetical protein [Acidipropionibacterium jensenii]